MCIYWCWCCSDRDGDKRKKQQKYHPPSPLLVYFFIIIFFFWFQIHHDGLAHLFRLLASGTPSPQPLRYPWILSLIQWSLTNRGWWMSCFKSHSWQRLSTKMVSHSIFAEGQRKHQKGAGFLIVAQSFKNGDLQSPNKCSKFYIMLAKSSLGKMDPQQFLLQQLQRPKIIWPSVFFAEFQASKGGSFGSQVEIKYPTCAEKGWKRFDIHWYHLISEKHLFKSSLLSLSPCDTIKNNSWVEVQKFSSIHLGIGEWVDLFGMKLSQMMCFQKALGFSAAGIAQNSSTTLSPLNCSDSLTYIGWFMHVGIKIFWDTLLICFELSSIDPKEEIWKNGDRLAGDSVSNPQSLRPKPGLTFSAVLFRTALATLSWAVQLVILNDTNIYEYHQLYVSNITIVPYEVRLSRNDIRCFL